VSLDENPTARFTAEVKKIYEVPRTVHGRWVYDVILEAEKSPNFRVGMTGTADFIIHRKTNSNLIPSWLAGGVQNSKIKIHIEDLYGEVKETEIYVGRSDGHSVEILSPVERGTTFLYRPAGFLEGPPVIPTSLLHPRE
jgi:hypothetical protein